MEYVKNQKDAIAMVKQMVADEQVAQDVAEKYFPELKESEDERIRKWLMEMIEELRKANPTNADHNGMCSEALAWLEKQGEQKPYGQREECLDCQVNYAGECKGSCAMKRGEQKLAWSEEDEKEFERLLNVLHANMYESFDNWLKSLKDRVQPQPKQEWSEEDENMFENTIGLIEVLDRETKGAYITKKYIKYLKSLKDRIQPKQEWSEEDKEQLDRALYMMEQLDMTKSWDDVYNWLKLLKYRYTWKPSDEQIRALEHFVRSVGESGYASPYDNNTKLLYSLLFDLKKLKL